MEIESEEEDAEVNQEGEDVEAEQDVEVDPDKAEYKQLPNKTKLLWERDRK